MRPRSLYVILFVVFIGLSAFQLTRSGEEAVKVSESECPYMQQNEAYTGMEDSECPAQMYTDEDGEHSECPYSGETTEPATDDEEEEEVAKVLKVKTS